MWRCKRQLKCTVVIVPVVSVLTHSCGRPFVIPQHGGGMSHGEHHMMPDGYSSINEAYSQSRVNLQTQFSLTW